MELNEANLRGLTLSYTTAFAEGMQRGRQLPSEMASEYLKLAELAMIVKSGGAEVVHAWMNQIPGFRRWLGDRTKKPITVNALSVKNGDWEDTVSVPRNAILDDQYGVYTPLMANLGAEGSDDALWLDMAMDALLANGQWVDGKAFFVTNRTYGANTINNTTTAALSDTTLAAALAAMQSFLGPENQPLNVIPMILVVGPSLRDTAWNLVKNSLVSAGTGKGGAIENPTKGRALLRVHQKLIGTHANKWYLLGQKGSMKPVGVQQRQMPMLVAKDDPKSENVFNKKEFIYGADARGEGFLTMPHLAYAGIVAA